LRLLFFSNKLLQNSKMSTITIEEFTQIKQEYFDAIPEGDALKAQLKSYNKEQKARHAQIYQYMRENNVMSTDLGGVTFEREEKTTVPAVSLKTLEEIIENPAVVEAYKRDYAKTKESLKVRKPKRQRVTE
jgi:hypothetical protein